MEYKLKEPRGDRRHWEIYWTEKVHRGGKWVVVPRRYSTGQEDEEKAKQVFSGWVTGQSDEFDLDLISTLSEVIQEYTKELISRKTTKRNMTRHYSIVKQLTNYFGNRKISSFCKQDVRNYIRSRPVLPQSASRELGVLNAALNFCHEEELIDWTPFKMKLVKSGVRDRFLTLSEIKVLLESCNEWFVQVWTTIALATAARSEAILQLTESNINFSDNIINFNNPSIEGKHKPRSIIRMPSALKPILKEAVSKSSSGFLVEKDGKPVQTIYRHFQKAVKKSGLKDVNPHCLRHTCAVQMAKNGVPILEISNYLGHTNTATTQNHYARFQPEFMTKSSEVGSNIISQTNNKLLVQG